MTWAELVAAEPGFEYLVRWHVMAYLLSMADGRIEIKDESMARLRVTDVHIYRDEHRQMTILEAT